MSLTTSVPCHVFVLLLSYVHVKSTATTLLSGEDDGLSHKIAGGEIASKGQFPWLASIQATNFEQGWHLCGGVLISGEWTLTAAHCLDSEKPEWLWVVTGEYDMDVEEGTEQRLLVDYFVQHPEYIYYEKPYSNDIALIHMSTPAVFDAYTQIAPLPSFSTSTFQSPCDEAGWGVTADGQPGTEFVEFASVSLLDSSVCLDAYGKFSEGDTCAGVEEGGVGFCAGDNGGPLHCSELEGGNSFVVSSIISWREGCASSDKPGVYMNIAFYLEWIINITQPAQRF